MIKQMIRTFTTSVRRRMIMKPDVRKKYIAEHGELSDYEIKSYLFSAPIYRENGEWIVDVHYGYHTYTREATESFDSVCPGQKYKMFYQVLPKEGDIIVHPATGRKFILGPDDGGLVVYKFPMIDMETNKVVAYVKAEEYYKD